MEPPDLRQWSDARQSLLATHIAGMVAYYQLGVITHRNHSRWDRQNVILPLIFLFFPLLYLCQIVVASLSVIRDLTWRKYQGLNYYICGLLGMYAKRISFHDADQNYDDTSERLGGGLLLDVFKPRAELRRRKWSEMRWFNIFMTLLALHQALSTSILYVRRWMRGGEEFLAMDHRIGLMAIGALSASLGYFFFESTGFFWVDILCTDKGPKLADYTHGTLHGDSSGNEVNIAKSLDVTNKHVFDAALAACTHLILLRSIGRHFPLFHRIDSSVTHAPLLLSLVPFAVTLIMVVPIVIFSFLASKLRHVWPREIWGSPFRMFIVVLAVYVAGATIYTEAMEVRDVLHHGPSSLNINWRWKDPWNDFLWSF